MSTTTTTSAPAPASAAPPGPRLDEIIPEPKGGAHRAAGDAITATGEAIARSLKGFAGLTPDQIRSQRREKFLNIGRNL